MAWIDPAVDEGDSQVRLAVHEKHNATRGFFLSGMIIIFQGGAEAGCWPRNYHECCSFSRKVLRAKQIGKTPGYDRR